MAKQSAIQKNLNRKILIDRLSEKRNKLKKLLLNKELPFEERVKIQMKIESPFRGIHLKLDLEIDVLFPVVLEEFTASLIYQE